MTDGNTEAAQQAAQEIINTQRTDVKRDLIGHGIYYTVVEGGHHTQALTDEEADFLCRQLVVGGLDQLEDYAAGRIAN